MRVILNNLVWLPLRELDARDQFRLKEDLSIIPKEQSFGKKAPEPKVIKLYRIAKSNIDGYGYIGVPRGYFYDVWPRRAINKYNYEIENQIPEHELLSSVSATYTLRPEDQAPDVEKFINLHKEQYQQKGFSLGIFDAFTGYGKCLKKGHKVISYSGDMKKVEDIIVGDLLMGPDSKPRKVLKTISGVEDLWKINPLRGEPFFCTGDHLLSLVVTNHCYKIGEKNSWLTPGNIVSIRVKDFVLLPKWKKHLLKLYFSDGIYFEEKKLPFSPYAIGCWLGDGTKKNTDITNPEQEVFDFFSDFAKEHGLIFRELPNIENKKCFQFRLNSVPDGFKRENLWLNFLREKCVSVCGQKTIPREYLFNSYDNRMLLLAGLLDTDGYLEKNSSTVFEISTQYEKLKDDILFLARSLGFVCGCVLKKSTIKSYGFEGFYWRISIKGDTYKIPTKVLRKKAKKSKSKTDKRRIGFQVSKDESGEYFGFELDGDNLFLKDDFLVMHNSIVSIEFIRLLRYRAIVLVHQTALMDQWVDNIRRYCPEMTVGKVGGGKADFEGKDIVVGTIQTLMQEDLSRLGENFFKSFGTVLCDEIHRMGGEKFGSVIPKFHSKHVISVSGTVRRADGCENVFKYSTGDVLVKGNQVNRQFPIVYIRNTGFNTSARTAGLEKPQLLSMIEKNMDRARLIANDVYKCLIAKRHPLIMSERLEILHRVQICLDQICKENNLEVTHGFYIGGKKQHELQEAAKADVVYATLQLAKEGIDIPRLCSIFMVTPSSDPEQSIGRILRRYPEKKTPMVIDYVDFNIAKFVSSYNSRMRLYRGLKWQVIGAVNK